MGEPGLGQSRCDRVSERLLRDPTPAGAANLSANSRSRRLLARTRCTRLLRSLGRNKAKRGPRRYIPGLGADHRSLWPRKSEETLYRVIWSVVTNGQRYDPSPSPMGSLTDQERQSGWKVKKRFDAKYSFFLGGRRPVRAQRADRLNYSDRSLTTVAVRMRSRFLI